MNFIQGIIFYLSPILGKACSHLYERLILSLIGVLMRKLITTVITVFVLSSPVSAEKGQWVEWIADIETSYRHINNLNLSAFSDDSHNDERLTLSGDFGRFYQFNGFTRMSLSVGLDAEKYQGFNLMDNTQLAANFGVRHKFGLGFYQPYLQFNADYRHKHVEWDTDSVDMFLATIEAGKHINNSLSVAVSIDFTSMNGEERPVIVPELSSEVFDQTFIHLSFYVDYIITQNWLASASYARREGDFHSSCSEANVAKVLELEKVKAITKDVVFSGCVYKLQGNSNILSASLGYSLTSHSALNFLIEHYKGHADVLDYQSTLFSLSYNYRY